MRFTDLVLPVLALALAAGCKSDTQPKREPGAPAAAAPSAAAAQGTEKFGATVSDGDALPVTAILDKPDDYSERSVLVEGVVRSVCSMKGCWMELAESVEKNLQGARVTFKDYGFFVPKDSAGTKARIEGIVHTKKVAASEVTHMEAEGATFARKDDDGTAREVRIVATGVELTR